MGSTFSPLLVALPGARPRFRWRMTSKESAWQIHPNEKEQDMHEQIGKILTEADAVLLRTSKIESAIQDEVAGLASLIANRLQSDRDFRKLECQAAIGDPAPGLAAAKKLAGEAKSALESASLRLNGFRAALGEPGGDFVSRFDEVAAALPAHHTRVVEAFAGEWQTASTT